MPTLLDQNAIVVDHAVAASCAVQRRHQNVLTDDCRHHMGR